jgi:L-2,4-diaminobutyrate decarboxylase
VIDDVLAELERDAAAGAGVPFVELVAAYLAENRAESVPVWPAATADELAARFAEPMPRSGRPLAEIVARLERDVLGSAIRLSHPMYLGHQVSAPVPAAIWSEMVAAALNNSLAVREMSPGATALETQLVRWLAELAGFGPGAGGTLTSGGTEATFAALLAARAATMPDAWERGVGDDPPVLVAGEHAHYAVTRAAGELGLGMSRVVAVPSRDWRMDAAALEATLERLGREGRRVMAVVATAGSTATGSFDDLERIGSLCEERGVWLHVDAAHGASALLSARHRHRLAGLSRARSIAWDPHKMMLVPLSAGMVLVREERELEAAFAQRAPYLFHGGEGRMWDQGVRSFQCSRRFDALKVWVALQRYGADGIGALYDRLADVAAALHREVVRRPEFSAVHEPESNIVCFRYAPPGGPAGAALDELNREVRERYNQSGAGWLTTTMLGGERVLRVTVMNPRSAEAHVVALLDGLAEVGSKLR